MNTAESILDLLTSRGFRLTLARRAIVDYFAHAHAPIDVEQLMLHLGHQKLHPNKTTLYRELAFLMEQGIVQEFDFGEGKKRYELSETGHHHHLICTNCKAVEGVEIEENGLVDQEQAFLKERGFSVTRHMLEFFGLCKQCSTKNVKGMS